MSVRNKCTHPGSIPDTSAFCPSTIFAEEPIIRETMRLHALAIVHLWTIAIPEQAVAHTEAHSDTVDIRGTIKAIQVVPGLFGLIFFHTFNNFLGGVFMSLMDAYGLSLVSVQVWGILWGFLSLGFIVGGLIVAKKGLGSNPLRRLFLVNIAMWTICVFFTLHASIVLLTAGLFVWLCLIPLPKPRSRRSCRRPSHLSVRDACLDFAQSIEQAASPITAFLIGPIARVRLHPIYDQGAPVSSLIGPWFGTGADRGIALVFIVAGLIGLMVMLWPCGRMRTTCCRHSIHESRDRSCARSSSCQG